MRRRQREPRALAQAINRLHERLAPGRLTDDETAIVILDRAGHDLRRAGAAAVGERDQRKVGVVAALDAAVVLIRILDAPARVDDQVPLLEKPVRHLDRLVERAAGILANVEHQALHALLGQVAKRRAKLPVGRLGKIAQLDVAGAVGHHERRVHAGNSDFVAHHFDVDQLVVARAPDRHLHRRAARPAQLQHRLLARPALRVLAVDLRDHIAAADALLVRRRSLEQRHDGDVAVDDVDADAEPVIVPFLPLAQLRVGLRIHEARMRIERLQHAVDRAVDDPVGLDRLDVSSVRSA